MLGHEMKLLLQVHRSMGPHAIQRLRCFLEAGAPRPENVNDVEIGSGRPLLVQKGQWTIHFFKKSNKISKA